MFDNQLTVRLLRALVLTYWTSACTPSKPCVPWVEPDTTYQIELIGDDRAPASQQPSCGEGFDLAVGDVFTFHDATYLNAETSCKVFQFRAEIEGVELRDRERFPTTSGTPTAFASGHAQVGADCSGEYTILVGGVSWPDSKDAPSDYLVARDFSGICQGSRSMFCADSWYVRVRDDSGKQLSKDNPEP